MIKESVLSGKDTIDFNKILYLKGIAEKTIPTLGAIETLVYLTPTHQVWHEFYVVNRNFPITTDALLGTDFLIKAKAIIDLENKGILLFGKFWLDFQPYISQDIGKQSKTIPSNNKDYSSNYKEIIKLANTEKDRAKQQNLDKEYYNLLAQYGHPTAELGNTIVRLMVMTKQLNEKSEPQIKEELSKNLSREERILKLVKILTTDETQVNAMRNIVSNFADIFHLEGEKLPSTDILYFTIPTKVDTIPINIRRYRLSPAQQIEVKRQVNDLLENDIIRHSSSPWSAPIVLVPKKSDVPNEKLFRLVFDYRKLNQQILRDSYPLPLIADILDRINGTKYFSKLDLSAGFHQIPIKESHKSLTAFSTPDGHYEFNKLPFGINSGPAAFARLMAFVLREHLEKGTCYAYIDDIVVLGKDMEEHKENLVGVLNTLRENNLSLKPAKCEFMTKKVIYLGFQITEFGVTPNPEKVEAIQTLEVKRTVRGIRSFLGAVGYYRKHTENFASLATPLTKLLKTKVKFIWTNECTMAVDKLKKSLITDCLLKGPDFTKGFILATDASCFAIGSALSQLNSNNIEEPIGFFSRTLTSPERNYSVTELEMLAIVSSCQHFRCYLIGAAIPTKIITDHQPLKFLFNVKQTSSRLVRWALKLQDYNYTIIYRPGSANVVADALSRAEPSATVTVITRAQAKQNQIQTTLAPIEEEQPSNDEEIDTVSKDASNMNSLVKEVPEREHKEQDKSSLINLNSESEIKEVLRLHHDSPLGAHFGVDKTINRIKQYYTWPGMAADIKLHIKNCTICQKVKAQGVTKAPMVIITTAKNSFERIAIDIVGPLTLTEKGNKYILTVQDDLTKWIIGIPLPNQEAETVAKALVNEVFLIYGVPIHLLSDNGGNFIGKLFTALCKFWRIHKMRTTAYHPECNGGLERSHFFLKNYLRAYANFDRDNWDDWLKFGTFAFNTTPHSATKISPYELLFGRKPNLPAGMSGTPEILYNYDDYLAEIKHKLQNANRVAQDNLQLAKLRSKKYYDKNTETTTYNVGDMVLLKANHNKIGRPLFEKWAGPYLVTDIPSLEGTIIKIGNQFKRYHNNLLKPYYNQTY